MITISSCSVSRTIARTRQNIRNAMLFNILSYMSDAPDQRQDGCRIDEFYLFSAT